MVQKNTDLGIPDTTCDSCDVTFNICWNAGSGFDSLQFCPFCGEEVDETVQDESESEE